MSVLINMEMPKNGCKDCIFINRKWHGDICQILKREVSGNVERGGFQSDCPLVEVPEPHGRLIDADALLSLDRQIYDGEIAVGRREYIFCFEVEDAPTIVPADHIGDVTKMVVDNDYAGLKVKYIVRKASNGELVDDCFVLRPVKDKAAIAALTAYADATENQVLAADIRKWLFAIIPAEEGE